MVGDAALDVLVRQHGPVVAGGDTRARTRLASGGAGANTARWLRLAGVEPVLLARVGDDAAGRLVSAELARAGVACAFAVDPDAPTCTVVVLVGDGGQRSMLADRGAGERLRPADVTGPALRTAAHVHVSGYVLLDPASRPAGLAALAAAREAGLTSSVDPQAAALLTDPAGFLADVTGVDLLLPNADELRALTGSAEPASARALLDAAGAVAVTAGPRGAAWVSADGLVTVPAEPATCVDSTGAGDAFDAGLLAAWLHGESTVDCLRAGVRLATRAMSVLGAQPE
ncbi:sugar/nucleoside kinase (ribokinase family) [Prauserella muralis]|nr:sugar/nucleoside kinase (ribokinase family) [Prauserella muralis]